MIRVLEEACKSLLIVRVRELLQNSVPNNSPHQIVKSFQQYLKDCYNSTASAGVVDREEWPQLLDAPFENQNSF